MGTVYTTAVGAPPVCTKASFDRWTRLLLKYRLNECPLTRTTTYYFSQSGNDSTGDGSIGSPWKTLAKASAVIAASSGNICLRFKRGDTWRETGTLSATITAQDSTTVTISPIPVHWGFAVGQAVTLKGGSDQTGLTVSSYNSDTGVVTLTGGTVDASRTSIEITSPIPLYINKANVTIRDYGSTALRRPIFSAFGNYYANPAFTATSGYSYVWEATEASTVVWLRRGGDNNEPLRKMSSIADVDATPGSWYQTGGKVYLRPTDWYNPNYGAGGGYQPIYSYNVTGIWVTNVDSVRIDNIIVEGYGAVSDDTYAINARPYGIKSVTNGTNTIVVSNCLVTYGGNHNIGLLGDSSGGITTIYNCEASFCRHNDSPFVNYTPNGGNEAILWGCTSRCAWLPSGLQPYTSGASGGPYVCHSTDNDTYFASLSLVRGCYVTPSQWQPGPFSPASNPNPFTDLNDCRAWMVDCDFEARATTAVDRQPRTYSLSSASGTSLTLTTALSAAIGPIDGQVVTISGGSSQPIQRKSAGYDPNTGVITLDSAITGSGRVSATWDVGLTSNNNAVLGNLPGANAAWINCLMSGNIVFERGLSTIGVLTNQGNGWAINCLFEMKMTGAAENNISQSVRGFTNNNSTNTKYYNCHITAETPPRDLWGISTTIVQDNGAASNALLMNSIVSCRAPGILYTELNGYQATGVGIGNVAARQRNNAYCGITLDTGIKGYSNDPYAVPIGESIGLWTIPDENSPLLVAAANEQDPNGTYRIEYDKRWTPRHPDYPVIGPFVTTQSTSQGDGSMVSGSVTGKLSLTTSYVSVVADTNAMIRAGQNQLVRLVIGITASGAPSDDETGYFLLDPSTTPFEISVDTNYTLWARSHGNDTAYLYYVK